MFHKSSDAVAQIKCTPRRPPQTAPVEQGAPGWPEGEVSSTQLVVQAGPSGELADCRRALRLGRDVWVWRYPSTPQPISGPSSSRQWRLQRAHAPCGGLERKSTPGKAAATAQESGAACLGRAGTKHRRLGGLTTDIDFSQFSKLEVQGQGTGQFGSWRSPRPGSQKAAFCVLTRSSATSSKDTHGVTCRGDLARRGVNTLHL